MSIEVNSKLRQNIVSSDGNEQLFEALGLLRSY